MAQRDTDLTLRERALLINRLQFPLIVRDYRDTGRELEDDTHYALHEMLGNLEPTTALLCAAMTLEEIALSHEGLTYLQECCKRLTEKYAPSVLEGRQIPFNDLLPLLADLEHIIELTHICRMSFELVHPETLVFLDILVPQLDAQMMIVEEALRLRGNFAPLSGPLKKTSIESLIGA